MSVLFGNVDQCFNFLLLIFEKVLEYAVDEMRWAMLRRLNQSGIIDNICI